MDWNKYNLVPTEFKTAREIGLAAATLGAMARRGFVEVLDGSPKKYKRIETPQIRVYQLLDEHANEFEEFFTLYKIGAPYGMLCSLDKSGDVLDCWGEKYDLNNIDYIKIGQNKYKLKENDNV